MNKLIALIALGLSTTVGATNLTPLQYGEMLVANHSTVTQGLTTERVKADVNSRGANNSATELLNRTDSIFTRLDLDGNKRLNSDELNR